ncbi:hypothetical protein BABINDRAFT_163344 [Babjeviella inositovora NRRL Y-12698]|uniref:Asparagine--tRNA ligase, mitochondrial n=1 Tax=Babjeviella inositovora NRRL Y-12698 TaxID=984486 RepID=A0A1E3QIV2_9ASCO|nr:uncharacterized protein BABINDRAFT_163344 [Babjeviella inositovora NRRL Y-12698]ODQ77621.1 hypothetical protein BABINDRAFT_163344 [Babjeviella inositovora NRRL Y-12698]
MFSRTLISFRTVLGRRQVSFSLPPTINQLFMNPPPANTEITTQGLVKAIRVFKKVAFIDISDGLNHHMLNVVIPDPSLLANSALELKIGQNIRVCGTWTECLKGSQSHELRLNAVDEKVAILGDVPADYPLQKKFHSSAYLRKELPTLRFKTNKLSSVLRFRSLVESELGAFFASHDFVKTHPPLITSSDCEGAGELFQVERAAAKGKFFGKNAYLTVSTQLHLEAICMALNRVWTLSPCFRAETSNTTRHLSEFWMLEAEVSYVDSVHQVTALAEAMIKHVVRQLQQDGPGGVADLEKSRFSMEEIAVMKHRWETLLAGDWPSVTYTEAVTILAKQHELVPFMYRPMWGESLQTEHEKWLAGEHFARPVFVTDYPKAMKPFYMKINDASLPEAQQTVGCFDLLVPDVGELIGGSMREHDYRKLQTEIMRLGMKPEEVQWYADLRTYGTVPHGGFGMGFERLLCYLANIENIRDVIPFPRAAESCVC